LELGEVFKITKEDFVVIGKEGTGPVEETDWVAELWSDFQEKFAEIENVTTASNYWGLMSDASSWLAPWQDQGKYLAGVECDLDVEAPAGWTKWVMPKMEYLTFQTDSANMDFMLQKMFNEVLPQQNLQVIAAIQEHYLTEFNSDQVELYLPVKLL